MPIRDFTLKIHMYIYYQEGEEKKQKNKKHHETTPNHLIIEKNGLARMWAISREHCITSIRNLFLKVK